MDTMELSLKFIQAQKSFNEACERYLVKFGANSLDRVILIDPLNDGQTKEDAKIAITDLFKGAQALDRAVRKNEPIEQIPEEMWENIVF